MGKFILGVVMVLMGLALGFYVSIILCLVGGLWDLIHFAQSGYTAYNLLVWGVVKCFSTTLAGTVSAYTLVIPGVFLMKTS